MSLSLGILGFIESIVIILVGIVLLVIGILLYRKFGNKMVKIVGYAAGVFGGLGIILGVVQLILALL